MAENKLEILKATLADAALLEEAAQFPSQKAAWKNADLHGWHDRPEPLTTRLLLLHCEISEAAEALRKCDRAAVEEELADVIIRILDLSECENFDIAKAVWEKHKKNIGRSYRHGNKAF